MAGRQGFEPRYADPESAVLPLDDLPKSGRFLEVTAFAFLVKLWFGFFVVWIFRYLSFSSFPLSLRSWKFLARRSKPPVRLVRRGSALAELINLLCPQFLVFLMGEQAYSPQCEDRARCQPASRIGLAWM